MSDIQPRKTKVKQRIFAVLLTIGAGILLYRALRLPFFEGGLQRSAWWVVALAFAEGAIDLACMICSIRWLITADRLHARLPMRFGTAATLLHAVRVLFFVLGRTGPLYNFDIRPEFRAAASFDWFWVYFAAVLAALGVAAVIISWRLIVRYRKKEQTPS